MANSLVITGDLIANRSLQLLAEQYPALSLFTTDFSDQGADYGSTIKTSLVTVGAAGNYTTSAGFSATDLTNPSVSITLNRFKYSAFELFPTEMASNVQSVIERNAQKVAIEIGDALMADIGALFISANYSNTTTCAVSAATRETVILEASEALNARKVKGPKFGLYNGSLHKQLWKDTTLVDRNFGGNGISENKLAKAHSVDSHEWNDLPTTSNLIGVIGRSDAVCIATRMPTDVSSLATGLAKTTLVTNAYNPDLGLTLQIRMFENPVKGSLSYVAALMYGVAVGQPAAIQLIKSA